MGLKITTTINGVTRTLNTAAQSLRDVQGPLKRLSKYKRFKIRKVFQQQGPGWPTLKKPSMEHRATQARERLERKLHRDVERAADKAKNVKTIERRKSVLDEFRRLEAGGDPDKSLLAPKQAAKLQQRIQRADDKGQRLLGRMPSSIKAEIAGGTLSIFSEIEWAGVHNDGGTAGHGARVPQREFLAVDEDDLDALEAFIFEEVDAAFNKA